MTESSLPGSNRTAYPKKMRRKQKDRGEGREKRGFLPEEFVNSIMIYLAHSCARAVLYHLHVLCEKHAWMCMKLFRRPVM